MVTDKAKAEGLDEAKVLYYVSNTVAQLDFEFSRFKIHDEEFSRKMAELQEWVNERLTYRYQV